MSTSSCESSGRYLPTMMPFVTSCTAVPIDCALAPKRLAISRLMSRSHSMPGSGRVSSTSRSPGILSMCSRIAVVTCAQVRIVVRGDIDHDVLAARRAVARLAHFDMHAGNVRGLLADFLFDLLARAALAIILHLDADMADIVDRLAALAVERIALSARRRIDRANTRHGLRDARNIHHDVALLVRREIAARRDIDARVAAVLVGEEDRAVIEEHEQRDDAERRFRARPTPRGRDGASAFRQGAHTSR